MDLNDILKMETGAIDNLSDKEKKEYMDIKYNLNNQDYMKYSLKFLKQLRDDYVDEIPEETIHSSMVVDGKIITSRYKCRKAWFAIYTAEIYNLKRRNLIPQSLNEEAVRLLDEYKENLARNNDLTIREDIDKSNEFLTKVINNLEVCLGE